MPHDQKELIESARLHLRTQFERGRVVLFTGAGFSATARNIDGEGCYLLGVHYPN